MIIEAILWIGSILALTGAVFNAKGNKIGFIYLNVGNIFTVIGAIATEQWSLLVMIVGFSIVNSWGYFNWRKKRIGINV